LNSKSISSSLLFILVIAASFVGWPAIAIFSMKAASAKTTSSNNGQNISSSGNLTMAGIDTGTNNTSNKIQQSKTEVNGTASKNSTTIAPVLHSNSTSNSTSPKIKNNSNKIAMSGGLSTKLTQSPSISKSTSNYNSNSKPLSISIQSSQNVVNGRGTSTITAVAYDATTGRKIENAVVTIKITYTSNGTSKEIVGHDGQANFSAEIKPNSKDNNNISFKTTVDASAPGYISTPKTSSSYTSTMTYFGSHQESIINNNGSGQLTQNILKNVQKKLEQNGINFALEK
jgi:hypothetical protein